MYKMLYFSIILSKIAKRWGFLLSM